MPDPITTGWAVQRADGTVIVDTAQDIDEAGIWRIALGWPTRGEVRDEIKRGGRAFRCAVVEIANV